MKTSEKIARVFSSVTGSAAMSLRILLRSRRPVGHRSAIPSRPMLIMANGPSLAHTLESERHAMAAYDLLTVNFAANAPVFRQLRPAHYVLADPLFFAGEAGGATVATLWENLLASDWPLTLHIPAPLASNDLCRQFATRSGHTLATFNMVATGGFSSLSRLAIDRGLAMPRPRNVLIPSIMEAIVMGYSRIYIAGADHTWTRTLSVDNNNRVITVQPHFYADKADHQAKVNSAYEGIHIHQVLESMSIAFRSYWEIADYARRRGIEIFNVTPGSFIDAFPRLSSLPLNP